MKSQRAGIACALFLCFSSVACSSDIGLSGECEFPVLAAGADVQLALSCIEGVVYEDTEYYVGCAPIHESRVGDVFLNDGGETRFTAAREITGLSPNDAFLLEAETASRECDGKEKLIAAADTFSRRDAGLFRVPTDAPNEDELERERAPWIVPGRYEVPNALEVEVTLSEEAITVTNRNRFVWRNCDQIQINDDVDEIWETGDYLDELPSGASHTWSLEAFGGDQHGLESLSEYSIDEIRGKPFIIMCRAPRGRAFGRAVL